MTLANWNFLVLESNLIPRMIGYKILFLQDVVPCYKAVVVMNYLKQYENDFTIMD